MEKVSDFINSQFLANEILKKGVFNKEISSIKKDYLVELNKFEGDLFDLKNNLLLGNSKYISYLKNFNSYFVLKDLKKPNIREELIKKDLKELKIYLENMKNTNQVKLSILQVNNDIIESELKDKVADLLKVNIQETNFINKANRYNITADRLNYNDFQQIGLSYFPELVDITNRLALKIKEDIKLGFEQIDNKHKAALLIPTLNNAIKQKELITPAIEKLRSTYTKLIMQIDKNYLRHLFNLDRNNFINYYLRELDFNSKEINSIFDDKVINKEKDIIKSNIFEYALENSRATTSTELSSIEKAKLLLSKHGVVSKEDAIKSVLNLVPNIGAESVCDGFKQKLIDNIIKQDKKNLVKNLDKALYTFNNNYFSSKELERLVLYTYLDEISMNLIKSNKI